MLDLIVRANDLEWQEASESYMRGTQVKILREDEGGKTILLKIPAGFRQESHSHLRTEQHYVLQGAYEMRGTLCPEGTYQLIHKNSTHGPITSEAGAQILVIWH